MLKNISIQEAQAITFSLFTEFRKLCEANDLRYYLSGGTLLGAVRHADFIPWDDDLDVMMPRPDYDKLLALKLTLPEGLQLFSCERDAQYFYPFAKLCDMRYKLSFAHHISERSIGMFIDIFPIEGLPDAIPAKKRYFRRMKLLNILRNSALREAFLPGEKYIAVKKLLMPIVRRRGANYYARRMNDAARRIPFGSTEHAGVSTITHYGSREWMPQQVFSPGGERSFHDTPCSVPAGWDEYLRALYGDYMRLPPEEQRVTDHANFVIELRD